MAKILHEKGGNHDTAVEFIPYVTLGPNLFSTDQKFVPFLGAGASLIPVQTTSETLHTPDASDSKIRELCDSFGLQDELACMLVAAAVRVALRLQADPSAKPGPAAASKAAVPPSKAPTAAELASELAASLAYDYFDEPARRLRQALKIETGEIAAMLRRATAATGVAATAPPLVGIASYYQYRDGPSNLWETLYSRFKGVTETTRVQRLVACAARHYLDGNPQEPYLCVTTNYDRLLELAMTSAGVPYCVVTVPKIGTFVRTTFSKGVQEHLGMDDEGFARLEELQNKMTPDQYYLRRNLAVIYKIHGSLDPSERQHDSVVISDDDYIDNIRQSGSNSKLIPNHFRTLMGYRNFLFLGYSFSDWNVRILYKQLQAIRADQQFESNDYAVMNQANPYESVFFHEKKINICLTTLDKFVEGVKPHAPRSKCLDAV